MRETLQGRLRQLPPFLCFALSRVHTKKLSHEDILRRFKWEKRKARQRLAWRGIRIPRKRMTRRMLRDEVAKKSGLHPRKVGRMCFQLSWDKIDTGDMMKFVDACGFDFFRMKRERYYLRNGFRNRKVGVFSHLTKSQFEKFNSLCKKFIEAQS
jgi:hypothetical protein